MSLPTAYLTSTKNLKAILEAIQNAQAPKKFTYSFLESLEFKSSSDRLILVEGTEQAQAPAQMKLGGLVYNIQLHLPESRDPGSI